MRVRTRLGGFLFVTSSWQRMKAIDFHKEWLRWMVWFYMLGLWPILERVLTCLLVAMLVRAG